MYLLDTNIISEVRKRERCDRKVGSWYAAVDDQELYLSVLVLGEIRRGLEVLKGRDETQRRSLEAWYRGVKGAFSGRILPVTDAVAELWGEMDATRRLPLFDGLMAATAKANELVLVTRNVKHVRGTHVRVLNPFVSRRVLVAR